MVYMTQKVSIGDQHIIFHYRPNSMIIVDPPRGLDSAASGCLVNLTDDLYATLHRNKQTT